MASRQPGWRRHRAAISVIFLLVGIMLGTWFTRIPQLRTDLGLDYGSLGVVLLAQTVGVIIAMQVAGHLATHLDSRSVIRSTAPLLPWFLPLVAMMPGAVPAGLGMLGWGMVAGLLDVAMNAQGVELERIGRRPVLSSLHAVWGVGALLGSLGTVVAGRAGWSLGTHFVVVAIALTTLAVAGGRHLHATVNGGAPDTRQRTRMGIFAGWTRAIVVLGALGAAVALCEGAVSSWSGVFLRDQRGAATNIASLAYFAFIVAQTGTRMVGDRVLRRFGAVALVRLSMVVTAAGVLLAVSIPNAWSGIAGFAMQGCGLAVAIPIIASAVGHGSTSSTSLAIARYSTLHQAGVLAGPPLLGWLAQAFGVGTALTLLVVPLGIIAVLAVATAPATSRPHPEVAAAAEPRT
ncbi:MFS transporter [Actinophytocola sp.]|uniref:MFS transporter n=1 Tax=Actinophytocola sp. TaxID=1872138 RepID=UPI0025BB005B|nr:MFS transporter [Actinophytocola sp.]